MKKCMRCFVLVLILVAAMPWRTAALATNVEGSKINITDKISGSGVTATFSLDEQENIINMAVTGASIKAGEQYLVLMVKGSEDSYTITPDNILYIDQAEASGEPAAVKFKVYPSSIQDSVILLAGATFGEEDSPIVAALVKVKEDKTYTIKFNATGGKVSPTSIQVAANAAYGELPVPTRAGYKFDGWYTLKTGGSVVKATTKATRNRTLYAHWTAVETFKITLNANGGTVDPAFLMVESGKTYLNDLPVPTKSGYKFDGWYTTRTGKTKITAATKATKARTIYAHWTAVETFKITLNANGGAVDPAFLMVESGKTYLNDLPVPTRPGYKFDGWYTTRTGKTKITAATKATRARTIYAHWSEDAVETFKITLNANGGTVDPAFLMVESGKTYLNDLPVPTRPGYKFDGWYTTRTGKTKITATTKATKARTVYAHWSEEAVETFKITLNANGGTVDPTFLMVESGKTYLNDLPTPTRDGFKFDGWYTTRTGKTKITAATKATKARTIYAHWESQTVNSLSDADEIAEDQAAMEMDEQECSFTAAPEDNNTVLELAE